MDKIQEYRGSGESNFEKKFYHNLMLVHKLIGNKITTGSDLYRLGKKLIGDKFRGIFTRRDIPKLNEGESAILNVPSNEHWISIFKKNGKLYEFDSFGRDMLGNGYTDFNTKDDNFDEQKIWQSDCGQRSVALLMSI